MKIDGYHLTHDTDAAKGTDAARKAAADRPVSKTAGAPATGGADKLELSSDAKLMAAALTAASAAPSVRTDVVEAMKQKLAAGEVGTDSGRLADRLIDDLLSR